MITNSLRQQVEKLINQSIDNIQAVPGGSINRAALIDTKDEQSFFLKWNDTAASDMFAKEKKGLELLQRAESGLRVPGVIGTGTSNDGINFILIEYIEEGSTGSKSSTLLGERLAALHGVTADQFGLDHDNYIGRLPQSNSKHNDWAVFFKNERLQPQLKMAVDQGKLSSDITQNFERLYEKIPQLLTDEPPSLLHGDLWGGNYFFDVSGDPVIYDPAVYYGNREIEIAFTHLFGGFSAAFYDAYQHAFPLQSGFNGRKNIYNLYPLLVHTNLFGSSYARRVESIVQKF